MHLSACYDLSSYCSVQTRGANATNCVVVRLMLDMSSPPVPVGWGVAEQCGGVRIAFPSHSVLSSRLP